MNYLKSFILFASILSFSSVFAFAQETGGLKGKVRATNGDGISGATVTARQNGKDIKSVTSDGKGNFELVNIKTGVYNITFDKSGYSSGVLYNVEVKKNKYSDLGDRLILTVDQGTLVIVKGSVFDQNGRSVGGAKVAIEKILSDGSTKKIGSGNASYSGEFTFRFPEGASKYRVIASAKGVEESKEISVDNAAIYRLAITLKLDK